MSRKSRREGADVVSLEEFRSKVANPSLTELAHPSMRYRPLDYLAYRSVGRVLELIKGKDNKRTLSVVYRIVDQQASAVIASEDRKGLYYALDASRDELEAITLDLEEDEEIKQHHLESPLTRLYYSTLVARHTLHDENRLRKDVHVSNPQIGLHEVRLENDQERLEGVTLLRAATGLGLIAVGQKRPALREQVSEYLQTVLVDRHTYALSLERLGTVLGKSPEDRLDVEEFLLGFCNPLQAFETRQIVSSSIPSEI